MYHFEPHEFRARQEPVLIGQQDSTRHNLLAYIGI
jgi:hypothetical protein